ncbi:MAG TPA: hypothetical protein VFS49_02760 [Croceibacterium sp.]|nr:hypothetical protein [Croceibacterium sp.]
MKNLILVAALSVTLVACDQAAEESDEPGAAATTEAAATATPTSSAGTYEVTLKDGTKFTSVLNPDGTYQDTGADGAVTEKGTWEDKDGKTCFDSEGGDAQIICFTVGETAADGSRVATPDDGTDPLTIKKTA